MCNFVCPTGEFSTFQLAMLNRLAAPSPMWDVEQSQQRPSAIGSCTKAEASVRQPVGLYTYGFMFFQLGIHIYI